MLHTHIGYRCCCYCGHCQHTVGTFCNNYVILYVKLCQLYRPRTLQILGQRRRCWLQHILTQHSHLASNSRLWPPVRGDPLIVPASVNRSSRTTGDEHFLATSFNNSNSLQQATHHHGFLTYLSSYYSHYTLTTPRPQLSPITLTTLSLHQAHSCHSHSLSPLMRLLDAIVHLQHSTSYYPNYKYTERSIKHSKVIIVPLHKQNIGLSSPDLPDI